MKAIEQYLQVALFIFFHLFPVENVQFKCVLWVLKTVVVSRCAIFRWEKIFVLFVAAKRKLLSIQMKTGEIREVVWIKPRMVDENSRFLSRATKSIISLTRFLSCDRTQVPSQTSKQTNNMVTHRVARAHGSFSYALHVSTWIWRVPKYLACVSVLRNTSHACFLIWLKNSRAAWNF